MSVRLASVLILLVGGCLDHASGTRRDGGTDGSAGSGGSGGSGGSSGGSSGTGVDSGVDTSLAERPQDQATDPAPGAETAVDALMVDAPIKLDAPNPVDTPAGAEAPPGACDPVAQNCGAGMECEVLCMPARLGCRTAAGAGVHGDLCGSTAPAGTSCSAGFTCIRDPAPDGGTATASHCRRFCNTTADCPSGKTCPTGTNRIMCADGTSVIIKTCSL